MAVLKLLRGRGVYDTRDGGLSLVSFRSVSKISMPTTTAGLPRVETVVTGETRQYLENGMERMLRSRQEISEMKERLGIIPYMDRTLASTGRRYLQPVRVLLKRDMVNLKVWTQMRILFTQTRLGMRNMLVSVAPMRLWRLKQGLRWALRLIPRLDERRACWTTNHAQRQHPTFQRQSYLHQFPNRESQKPFPDDSTLDET